MLRKISFTILLLANIPVFAQPSVSVGKEIMIDSLMQIIKGTADDSTRIHNYLEIVRIIHSDNPATAKEYLGIAASLASQEAYHEQDATLFYYQGSVAADLGKPEEAITFLSKALEANPPHENNILKGNAFLRRALIFIRQDESANAMADLVEAEKIFKTAQDNEGLGDVQMNMGIVYFYQDLLLVAREHFEKALALFVWAGDELGQSKCHLNLGVVSKNQGLNEEAIKHYQHSLAYFEEKDLKKEQAFILNNLGSLELSRKQPKNAFPYLEEALALSFLTQNKSIRVTIWLNLGEAYHDLKNYDKAIPYFEDAFALADSMNMDNKKLDIAQKLAASYDSLKQAKEALAWMHTAFSLQDTLDKKIEQEELLKVQAEFQMKEQEEENESLKAEQEIQQLRNFAISIGMIFVSIITLVLFFSFRRKKKINIRLEEQQDAISSQNRKLQEQHDRLESLNQEKNMMMGMLAHDIRDPLAKIEGISNILLDQSNLSIQQTSFLGHIRLTAQNLSSMSQRLLSLEALEAGKLPLKLGPVDWIGVTLERVESFRTRAFTKRIKLFTCDFSMKSLAWGEVEALTQVIDNLLSNAIKFSPAKSGVEICFEETEKEICIKITDQGPGIEKKEFGTLFNRYQIQKNTHAPNENTGGLGLALVNKYIEAMKGRVRFESKVGEGTTFLVFLSKATEYGFISA